MVRVIRAVLLATVMLPAQPKLTFMDRAVTIEVPKTDESGLFPEGPATICLEGSPRQCYTPPKDFGGNPEASIIQVSRDTQALFFSAASGGVSGFGIHFALLRSGGKQLEDMFIGDTVVSNQSEHAWWTDPLISSAKIFVTADYRWGPEESHYGLHRYLVSAYLIDSNEPNSAHFYYLGDQYMTARKYSSETDHILDTEKPEILARLKRVKQQSPR